MYRDQGGSYPLKDKLCYSVAFLNCIAWLVSLPVRISMCYHDLTFEIIVRMVEKQHLELPSIVRIDHARACVYEVLHCQSASRRYPTV